MPNLEEIHRRAVDRRSEDARKLIERIMSPVQASGGGLDLAAIDRARLGVLPLALPAQISVAHLLFCNPQ